MSAKRAARQIVAALAGGRAERVLGTPANLLARAHGLFPELTIKALGVANWLLPRAPQPAGPPPTEPVFTGR
ncbi:MAG TPA: hypothetical protein VKV17_00490 [Bryobacteraceae bacterium]|nr:hypothetical protein [Bryobacteraceae bacterium]